MMHQRDFFLYVFFAVPAAISFLCNLLVVISYLKCPSVHSKSFTAIAILCVFDLVTGFFAAIPYMWVEKGGILCTLQGTMLVCSEYASILWIGNISLITLMDTFKPHLDPFKYFYKPLMIIVILSVTVSILPFFFTGYGYLGGHCWVIGRSEGDTITQCAFLVPLVVLATVSGVILLISSKHYSKNVLRRMVYYSSVLIISYLPMCVARIVQAFHVTLSLEVVCIAYFILPLGGATDALIFGFFSGIWNKKKNTKTQCESFLINLTFKANSPGSFKDSDTIIRHIQRK